MHRLSRPCSLALLLLAACTSRPLSLDGETETNTEASSTSNSETSSATETSSTGVETSSTGLAPDLGKPWVPEQDGCDVRQQDCPEGQKCVPISTNTMDWGANACVPVLGDGQIGDACHYDGIVAGTDDCDADSLCWDVEDANGELLGTCLAFCTDQDDPQCPLGTTCEVPDYAPVALCLPRCDPLAQDCGAGSGCYWAQDAFRCLFYSAEPPAGEPCGFINDCYPGSVCLPAELLPSCAGASCCASFCDLNDPSCWDMQTSCVPFFEPGQAPVELEHIGVCVVP